MICKYTEHLSKIGMSFALAFICSPLLAWDDSPPCFRQLETSFFVSSYVSEALSLHSRTIPQSTWASIQVSLNQMSQQIPDLLTREARKMNSNPLEHPFQAQKAFDLLMAVLYQNFRVILIANLVTNEGEIQEVFFYIRDKQKARIQACLPNVRILPPGHTE